jgi:hypothetical protein
MTGRPSPRVTPEPAAYAGALVVYADGRLDGHTLRAWTTQHLVLDLQLDHDAAAIVADEAARGAGRPTRYFPAPLAGHSRMWRGHHTRRLRL